LRIFVVRAGYYGCLCVFWKRWLDQGNSISNVLHGSGHVGIQVELDTRLASTFKGSRGYSFYTCDAVKGLVNAAGNFPFHRFGRGAWITNVNKGNGRVDVGQLFDPEPQVRKNA
jgi:hypothetical protein